MSGLVGPPDRALLRREARGEIRTTALHATVVAGFCTAGFALAIGVRAPDTELAVRMFAASIVAAILAVAIRALVAGSRSRPGPTFDELARTTVEEAAGPPAEITSLELAVRLGSTAAGDYHIRLRPVLTALAAQRLATKGIRLELPRHRERAEAVLGTEVYTLVRPDATPPVERFAPGPSPERLESVTSTLERLG